MKKLSSILALALALVMVVAMAPRAHAADNGEITVTGATAGQEYELYRVFNVTGSNPNASGDYQNVAYSIAPKWAGFFAAGQPGAAYLVDTLPAGKTYPSLEYNGAVKYIAIEDSNVADFALAALGYIANVANDGRETAADTTLTFTGLPLGYYLVYPVGATDNVGNYTSIASLTSTTPKATVATKATPPTIEKEVTDHHTEVGQTVTFTVTGQVPNTTGYTKYTYKVSDSMTYGLTFNQAIAGLTLKIGGDTVTFDQADGNTNGMAKVSAVTWTAMDKTTNTQAGFEFTIDMTEFQDKIGEAVVVTYSAKVNEDAIVNGAENEATLEYSNDPSDENSTDTDRDDEKLHTSKIVIEKVDGDDHSVKLEGAEFVLYKTYMYQIGGGGTPTTVTKYYKWNAAAGAVEWVDDINDATVATTNASGVSEEFKGLAEGTYFLKEIKAPAGYNLLPTDVRVDITDSSATSSTTTVVVDALVENNSGTELPETGGVGTTIFYGVGGLLVVGAALTLLARRRVGADVEE